MQSVVVEKLYKKFDIYHDRPSSVKALITGGLRPVRESINVLNDISFTVAQGETLAIVGRNGSGKSTMLSLIAGIYRPDKGRLDVSGRISPLLELGAGFHPDLTGMENIFLNASILGLTRKETNERLDLIIEFAELKSFVDLPIRKYSSGMVARLGFAVAIHTNPDILLVDEVLGVGDAAFQEKCEAKIREFQRNGKTIIFVSHSTVSVRKVSTRAIWLDKGVLRMDGGVEEVLAAYTETYQK
ncbi:MAG TPA: ABC transporter ATP-binding protein [Armatimonadota bacterium]|jgi:ABC-type polysaccharide/polyol phosphate transport system ATPase subunit